MMTIIKKLLHLFSHMYDVGSSRHHRAEGREGQYEGGPRHHQPEQLLAPSWSEYRPRFPGARLPRDGLDVLR